MEWRVIPAYPAYEVSEDGQVRRAGRVLKGQVGRNNSRWRYMLHGKHNDQYYDVHVLVAHVFIGPPPFDGAIVCHKDDDVTNNHWSNLYWGTHKDNKRDAIANGRIPMGNRHQNAKLTAAKVGAIRHLYKQGGYSHAKLALMYNVGEATIQNVLTYRTWRSPEN